jgi:hypothetical protein
VNGKQIDPEPYFYHLQEDDMTREEVIKIIEESRVVYHKIADLPEWAKPTIEKLIHIGGITPDKDGSINLSHDLTRSLVIQDRIGGK